MDRFWEAIRLAYTIIGWMFAAATEPVGAEIPVPDPQLAFGVASDSNWPGAGGTSLVIKRLE